VRTEVRSAIVGGGSEYIKKGRRGIEEPKSPPRR